MARKKIIIEMILSVDEDVSSEMAAKEVRSRINDACCYRYEQEAVRVRKIHRAARVRPKPARCKPRECW